MCNNACARPWVRQPQSVRKGIVAQATVRITAGGFVAASLLMLGPLPAQAVAEKHGSDSQYQNDHQGNRSNKPGSARAGSQPSTYPPTTNLRSDGSGLGELAVVDSVQTVGDAPVALRSAAVEEVPTGNAVGAVPRPGSDYTSSTAAAVRAPRVVIGNGRTPMWHARDGDAEVIYLSAGQAEVMPEDVPPLPTAIEINIPPLPPPPLTPIEKIRAARVAVESSIRRGSIRRPTRWPGSPG